MLVIILTTISLYYCLFIYGYLKIWLGKYSVRRLKFRLGKYISDIEEIFNDTIGYFPKLYYFDDFSDKIFLIIYDGNKPIGFNILVEIDNILEIELTIINPKYQHSKLKNYTIFSIFLYMIENIHKILFDNVYLIIYSRNATAFKLFNFYFKNCYPNLLKSISSDKYKNIFNLYKKYNEKENRIFNDETFIITNSFNDTDEFNFLTSTYKTRQSTDIRYNHYISKLEKTDGFCLITNFNLFDWIYLFFIESFINSLFSRFIVYTKIFQWFNFKQNNYIGKHIYNYLKIFTDKSPYVDSDINLDILKELISKGIDLNPVPINSGSIALVFKGKYNNQDVAIKILRNNIENKIVNVIDTLLFIGNTLRLYNFVTFIMSIKTKLLEQISLDKEADSIKLFGILKHKNIKTITPYLELCTKNYIVMEFINGKTIFQLTEDEKIKCLDVYIKFMIYTLFNRHLIHLDFHPGNVLFITEDTFKVCPLDLGLIMYVKNMDEMDFVFSFFTLVFSSFDKNNLEKLVIEYKDILFNDSPNLTNFIQKIQEMDEDRDTSLNKLISDIVIFLDNIKIHKLQINENIYKMLLGLISNISLILYLDDTGIYESRILEELDRMIK